MVSAYSVLILVAVAVCAAGRATIKEEFNYFDSSNWYVEVTGNPNNNELQYYTDRSENYRVENGHLVITPLKENYGGRSYTSARLKSSFSWKYGRVEVRAKLPNGFGLWPAIWMMPRYSVYGGWPQSGEIDIMEARGQYLDQFGSTIHYGICCDQHFWEGSGDMKLQCSIDEYHVYTLDWTPTELVYRMDGKAYYRQDLDRVISYMYSAKGQPFDQEFYMILNVAIGGDYLENPKPTTKWNYPDAEMWIDYVRVYPLEDIASSSGGCHAKSDADKHELCANVMWACESQNYADVSQQCTAELTTCCDHESLCDMDRLVEMASEVYAEYDKQVNDAGSCDFSGTATKGSWVLKDGGVQESGSGSCVIKSGSSASDICGALQWACNDQSYTDVSTQCNAASDQLTCCGRSPALCNYNDLVEGAGKVFQAYHSQIPSDTSCDFGGVCQLEGGLFPLQCTDGYGG